jgi:hypothetical protein
LGGAAYATAPDEPTSKAKVETIKVGLRIGRILPDLVCGGDTVEETADGAQKDTVVGEWTGFGNPEGCADVVIERYDRASTPDETVGDEPTSPNPER